MNTLIFRIYATSSATIIAFFITYMIINYVIESLGKIPPLLLIVIATVQFIAMFAHIFVVLCEVNNSEKSKKFLQTLIEVDHKIRTDVKLKSFKRHLIVMHSIYAIIKLMDVYYEVFFGEKIDEIVIMFSLMNICSDVEVMHFVVEGNELARRFERLNILLSKCVECKLYDGLLMKLWNRNYDVHWSDGDKFQIATDVFVKISHAVRDLNSCFFSTVKLL